MNELTIDGKTFISSKRAAEITGYAKDYVGQLCREGRVTAKLVGRSWYVLESSIKDHRYASEEPKERVVTRRDVASTWEAPKYAAESPVQIPQVAMKPAGAPQQGTVQAMQEAWQEWFSMRQASVPINAAIETREYETAMDDASEPDRVPEATEKEADPLDSSEQRDEANDSEPVSIPIERIRVAPRAELPVERPLPPQLEAEEPLFMELEEEFKQKGAVAAVLKGFAAVVVVVAIVVGVLGTGVANPYLAKYGIIGYTSFITGTTQYSK